MYICPDISEAEAHTIFMIKKRRNPISFFRRAKLKRVELFYVPLYLFEILIQSEKGVNCTVICCDAILGETAIFKGQDHQHSEQALGKVFRPELDPEQVEEKVRKYGHDLILDQTMGYGRKGSLQDVNFTETVFYPFWVGYFEKRGCYDFRITDGITGQLQGPKMRLLFLQFLRQLS